MKVMIRSIEQLTQWVRTDGDVPQPGSHGKSVDIPGFQYVTVDTTLAGVPFGGLVLPSIQADELCVGGLYELTITLRPFPLPITDAATRTSHD